MRRFKDENEGLIVKMKKLESDVKIYEADKKKLRMEMDEKDIVINKLRVEKKTEQEEVIRLRRKVEELEREKESGLQEEQIDFHIPIKENRLFGKPSWSKSFDDTVFCFLDEENGVGCIHTQLRVRGKLTEIKFRKRTQMVRKRNEKMD